MAPPELVPTEMMRLLSPGITASLCFRNRTPAFRSAMATGPRPMTLPSSVVVCLPRSPTMHTTTPSAIMFSTQPFWVERVDWPAMPKGTMPT